MQQYGELRYIPIFLESVIVDTILDFDLFLYNRQVNNYVLYRSKRTRFTELTRLHLLRNNVPALFIAAQEVREYNQYIEKNLNLIVGNPALKTEEKANIIYQTARNVMESVMEDPRAGESIQRSRRFVQHTVRYILHEKDYFFNIINLTLHDYYTYTHSINVCIYTLSLAHRVGITSPHLLNSIGGGALLHDIGKSTISQEILLKKGPLNAAEWEIIKEHPDRGVAILKGHSNINSTMIDIVRYHHEKLDGSGYPEGLTDEKIPFYAKIACIADIFDALNTNRPYRKAADTFHSLEIIKQEFEGKVDRELFREFVLLFKR